MAKLIYTGSTLESDLNNMKEINDILDKPCRYYNNKADTLDFLSLIFTFLFFTSSILFIFSCFSSGFTKAKLLTAAVTVIAFICLMVKLDNYNSAFYLTPYRNLKNKKYDSSLINIKEIGIEGENATLELLKKLDDSYSIIYGYPVVDESRNDRLNNCELDFLVLGPNGIFIIENKNIIGEIEGKSTDSFLKRYKTSYGNIFEEDYKNPIKQVLRQLSIFKKFLADNNLADSFIKPIVYFCNEDCTVNIENTSNVEVLCAGDDLISFIESYNGRSFSSYAEKRFLAFTREYLADFNAKNTIKYREKINEVNNYISSEQFMVS